MGFTRGWRSKQAHNTGSENWPGIQPFSAIARNPPPPPCPPFTPPVPYIFRRFYNWGWYAGEVIALTLKTVPDFPRLLMAQQLDLSSFITPLSVPIARHLHFPHIREQQTWDGNFFFSIPASCSSSLSPPPPSWLTMFHWWQQQGQGKVKSTTKQTLFPSTEVVHAFTVIATRAM